MYTGINVNMYRLGIMSMNNAYLDKDFKRETAEASFSYIAISTICSNGFSFILGYFKELLKLQQITKS